MTETDRLAEIRARLSRARVDADARIIVFGGDVKYLLDLVDEYRAALEWYADEKNYELGPPFRRHAVDNDEGARARAALEPDQPD